MKTILFAWRRLTPPGFIGGAEITEGLWAAVFASLGYEVRFIGSAENPRNPNVTSRDWLQRMLKHENIEHSVAGSRIEYIWRGVHCICVPQAEVLISTRTALAQGAVLLWTSQEGCDEIASLADVLPVVSYMHSVTDVGMLSATIGARFLLVPSWFVQRAVRARMGTDSSLARPIIEGGPQLAISAEGRDIILFVNPIPEKGLNVALALAEAIPDRQFVFVEGWRGFESMGRQVPSNVEVLTRQPCLRALYARARFVIVPSIVPDAAPRVVSEAGRHGIPILGSTSGGIPELVANPMKNCISTSQRDRWIARAVQLLEEEAIWTHASLAQRSRTEGLTCDPRSVIAQVGVLGAAG